MLETKEWEDLVDAGAQKIVGEIQLQAYGKFLDEYASQLQAIEDALDEYITDSWDMTLDPIALQVLPYEQSTLSKLIDTDNKVLNKVLTVLAGLCSEMEFLKCKARNNFYNALLFYGEGVSDASVEGHSQMSQMIPLLQEIDCFVKRCEVVAHNATQQLATLYSISKSTNPIIDVSDVHFQTVFEHISELLTVLITLDEIISSQSTFQEHWTLYKRMIKSIRHNPSRFGTSLENLRKLEEILSKLEDRLFGGKIFQTCICQTFDNGRGAIGKNTAFMEEFMYNIHMIISEIENKSMNQLGCEHRFRYVGVAALYVMHFTLFHTVDKKLFRLLWDISKKIPVVTLVGNVTWFPEEFFISKLPTLVKTLDKKIQQSFINNRIIFLQQKTQTLAKEVQTLALQLVYVKPKVS